jgi:hypothetical protein
MTGGIIDYIINHCYKINEDFQIRHLALLLLQKAAVLLMQEYLVVVLGVLLSRMTTIIFKWT